MADETATNLDGQSFENHAVRGAGTLLPDGTVTHTQDPTQVRGVSGRTTSGGRPLPEPRTVLEPVPVEQATTSASKGKSAKSGGTSEQ